MTQEQDDRFYLSGILFDIAGIAGRDAAISVCKAAGGTRVYFPRHPDAKHWLTLAVGHEAAKKICEEIVAEKGGIEIEIPLSSIGTLFSVREQIRQQIEASYLRGHDTATAARLAGVHQKTARRHYALLKASSPHGHPRPTVQQKGDGR